MGAPDPELAGCESAASGALARARGYVLFPGCAPRWLGGLVQITQLVWASTSTFVERTH